MSNATIRHTPGPWTPDWDDSGQWYVNIGGLCVSGNALRGDSGDCVESANARLIAAAPLMYDVLKLLITFPRNLEHRALAELAAHDAIAKVEGR
jgi:hypothetical protein